MDTTVGMPHLRYFIAVVDTGSFSKAALRCHTSVSNISEQIQNFEKRIEKVLLDRNRRQIVPTEAGKILLQRARNILANIEQARLEVRSADRTSAGKTSVGVLMTLAPSFSVHFFGSFVEKFPKIQISVHETTTARMLAMLDEGELDMGITALPVRDNGFDTVKLFSEEMLLALPSSHPLTRKQTIQKEDLESEKFILSKEDHGLGGWGLRLCRHKHFSPRIIFNGGHLATIQSLVAAGKGISLLPQTAIAETPANITYRQLENPRPKRSIAIVTRSKRPLEPAARQFLQHLREASETFTLPMANDPKPTTSEKLKA
jgi:LysR family transcriptional regulator, hydrogen peroxide-inducible genes activator